MARVLLANRSEVTQNHSNPNLLSILNGKLLINSFNVCYNECKVAVWRCYWCYQCFCLTGDNPQYKLELLSSDRDTVVWILLTRHITQKVHLR